MAETPVGKAEPVVRRTIRAVPRIGRRRGVDPSLAARTRGDGRQHPRGEAGIGSEVVLQDRRWDITIGVLLMGEDHPPMVMGEVVLVIRAGKAGVPTSAGLLGDQAAQAKRSWVETTPVLEEKAAGVLTDETRPGARGRWQTRRS